MEICLGCKNFEQRTKGCKALNSNEDLRAARLEFLKNRLCPFALVVNSITGETEQGELYINTSNRLVFESKGKVPTTEG